MYQGFLKNLICFILIFYLLNLADAADKVKKGQAILKAQLGLLQGKGPKPEVTKKSGKGQ
jgi:hypothetical protein